jgi:catechol 2,3-dioxygenase-like lactoylglutathione lyase family enzyme
VFAHVALRVADVVETAAFYELVLGAIGVERAQCELRLGATTAQRRRTRNVHIGFAAPSRAHVDRFWRTGVEAGHRDDGPPGERAYTGTYYGAFLLDPDGNSAEAVHRDGLRTDGVVDHVWLRVRDVAAARAFYLGLAGDVDLRLGTDTPERVSFVRSGPGGGTFSLVAGDEPTECLELGLLSPSGRAATLHDPDGNVVELVPRG